MNRKITCTNEDGVQLTLTSRFLSFLLQHCDGIYGFKVNNAISDNTMTDGGTHQGAVVMVRNIVLTIADKEKHQDNRELVYKCFKPNSIGTFVYEENEKKRQIEYYVEDVDFDSVKNVRVGTISLKCTDPFFSELEDVAIMMAGWKGAFHFRHAFKVGGEPFGYRVRERLKEVKNDSAADNIGITVRVTTLGNVTNPAIVHVEKGERIAIGSDAVPFVMNPGDILEITTGVNNKHIYLTRNGVREEINYYLTEDSEFIQLSRGINTIGYEAAAGEEHMTVEIMFRYKYLGV